MDLEEKSQELLQIVKDWIKSPHLEGALRDDFYLFLDDFQQECQKEIPNETDPSNSRRTE